MKLFSIIAAVFVIWIQAPTFAGGLAVGNGGDIVLCQGERNYLSFDYVIGKYEHRDLKLPADQRNLSKSFARISKFIEAGVPALKNSFDEFSQQVENSDAAKEYLWYPVREFDLDQVYDENFPSEAFANCRGQAYTPVEFIQAIIRYSLTTGTNQKTVFFYDKESISHLKNATQKSFLYVHEWLWNICPSAAEIRRVNYYLHSKTIESASPEQIRQEFQNSCPI